MLQYSANYADESNAVGSQHLNQNQMVFICECASDISSFLIQNNTVRICISN